MGIYNLLMEQLTCPRCDAVALPYTQLEFGYCNLIEYKIGDVVEWRPRKLVRNGGRPEYGNMDAEGYATCSNCDKDFYVIVRVREDRITGVELDTSKRGLVPD